MTAEDREKIKGAVERSVVWSGLCDSLTVAQARDLIADINTRVLYVVDHPQKEDK